MTHPTPPACENTDTPLGEVGGVRIWKTKYGGLGMEVGAVCQVRHPLQWYSLANAAMNKPPEGNADVEHTKLRLIRTIGDYGVQCATSGKIDPPPELNAAIDALGALAQAQHSNAGADVKRVMALALACRYAQTDGDARVACTALESAIRALAQAPKPIDMVLHCPACGMQHIDAPEVDRGDCSMPQDTQPLQRDGWENPPHRSHLCHGCGHIWRPADVPTNGVAAVKTKGKADSPIDQAPNPWRDAIDAELSVLHSCVMTDETPKHALDRLIDWHVQAALDPAVSSDARGLIDRGGAQAPKGAGCRQNARGW